MPTPPERRTKTDARKSAWLTAFRRELTVTAACTSVGVARSLAYQWRNDDPDFAADWAAAEAEIVDTMERELHRRAVEGVEEPVFQNGRQVGAVRRFSDTLLIFGLKARAPHRYRDNHRVEHVAPAAPRADLSKLSDDELAQLERISRKIHGDDA